MCNENMTPNAARSKVPEEVPVLIRKIGKTTYKVRVHFSDTSTETMSDKIKRMLKMRYNRCDYLYIKNRLKGDDFCRIIAF